MIARVKEGVCGIVLAGGMSRRLGRNKALEPVGGSPLLQRVIGRLAQIASEVVVVVADLKTSESLPLPDGVTITADIYPGKGSLGGIFSGLSASRMQWGGVVACDMPFLNLELLLYMISLRAGHDAVVPVVDGRPEPTHAIYSRACLPNIEARLAADDLKIARFFDEVRVRYVSQEEVASLDPDFLSFFNVNTQDDLERAVALADEGR